MCISEQELQVLGTYFTPYWVTDIASKNHCIKCIVFFYFLFSIQNPSIPGTRQPGQDPWDVDLTSPEVWPVGPQAAQHLFPPQGWRCCSLCPGIWQPSHGVQKISKCFVGLTGSLGFHLVVNSYENALAGTSVTNRKPSPTDRCQPTLVAFL